MNNLQKRKKGFTLTELAIVIAVIAILVAVLVPTFIALINKAKQSNDVTIVKNLNTAVAMEEASGGIVTVSDAIDAALDNGYSVGDLSPESENTLIVYDQLSNRFVLIEDNMEEVIYKDESATTKTNFKTATTWVFVDAAATKTDYVEIKQEEIAADTVGYNITGTNSYILTGSKWNGLSVKVPYGVELYDYTNTAELHTAIVTNSDTTGTQQKDTVTAATQIASNVKKTAAVKAATDVKESVIKKLIVNVNTIFLTCQAEVYTINGYGTTIKTTVIGCNFNEYGTAATYDATSVNGCKLTNYNSALTNVVVYPPEGKTVSDVYTDTTNKVTLIEVSPSGIYVTVNDDGTIDIQAGSSEYPYLISSAADLTTLHGSGLNNGGYYKLTQDIQVTDTVILENIETTLDLDNYTLSWGDNDTYTPIAVYSGATLTVKASGENGAIIGNANSIYNYLSTVIIESGIITGNVYQGIYNEGGNVTINGGTVTGHNNGIYNDDCIYDKDGDVTGYYNNTSVTVNGGTVTGNNYNGIYCYHGSITVNGGDITGKGDNDGAINCEETELKVCGGNFYGNVYGIGVYSSSTANIKGGYISAVYYGVCVEGSSVATIGGSAYITATGEGLKEGNWLYGIEINTSSTVTIEDGATIYVSKDNYKTAGIKLWGPGTVSGEQTYTTLTVNGGTIYGGNHGISGDNQQTNVTDHRYTKAYINGGTITGGEVGIFQPQVGELEIKGGSITGSDSAVEIRSGKLTITGGTFTATAAELKTEDKQLSTATVNKVDIVTVETTVIGAAIAVSQGDSNNTITVQISGGKFAACCGVYETDTEDTEDKSSGVTVTISGGDYSGCTQAYKSENNKITDGRAA